MTPAARRLLEEMRALKEAVEHLATRARIGEPDARYWREVMAVTEAAALRAGERAQRLEDSLRRIAALDSGESLKAATSLARAALRAQP